MREIDLIEFIKTGELGFIKLGSDKDELRRVFGQPKHINRWGGGQNIESVAWEFDNLLFGFDINTEKVCIINMLRKKIKQAPSVGNKAMINNHGIKFGMEPEEFEDIVNNHDVFYKEKIRWDEDGWVLEYPSGVDVSFQGDLNKNAPLFDFYLQNR
jgi:hypothetical protein